VKEGKHPLSSLKGNNKHIVPPNSIKNERTPPRKNPLSEGENGFFSQQREERKPCCVVKKPSLGENFFL